MESSFAGTGVLAWIGIAVCVTQSATFSGLNLAFFSLSRLRLESDAAHGNKAAATVLELRRDSNFLLTTILWGNVGINVLLTMLSNSVLLGISAFVFSTVIITFFGEIIPQAYFARNAMKMATMLAPVMKFYQFLLYPVAKPSAIMLDRWLGKEIVQYMKEKDLRRILARHLEADDTEMDYVEGIGALNFLDIDDLTAAQEGEPLDTQSIIRLPCQVDLPIIPQVSASPTDPFVMQVNASGHKWVVLADEQGEPRLILDADGYLRALFLDTAPVDPYAYCHRPIVVRDASTPLDQVILQMKSSISQESSEAIKHDIVLIWHDERKVITGADILGRLLEGISIKQRSDP